MQKFNDPVLIVVRYNQTTEYCLMERRIAQSCIINFKHHAIEELDEQLRNELELTGTIHQ